MKKKVLSLGLVFTMFLLLISSLGMTCLAVEPETIVFQDLGTSAPPTALEDYVLVAQSDHYSELQTVTAIPTVLGNITADGSLSVRTVPANWTTWSHSYTGRIYFTTNNAITLTMPGGVKALVFYVEPNTGTHSFTVQMNSGTVYTKSIDFSGGAAGFGFYSTGDATIESVSVSTEGSAGGFGIGEIYVNPPIPAAPSAPVLSATGSSITVQPVNGCEYSLDNQNWTDINTFSTDIKPVTQYTVYMRYKKTVSASASNAASAQITTPKATQSAPETPQVTSSGNGISVQPVNGCEYSLDNQNWTDSNTFSTGIKPVTQYTVYMRYKETASAFVSAASSVQITTPKATQSAPETPQVTSSGNEISVAPVNGCEYSLDNQNWTDSNTFSTGIKPVTQYTVYMRYKETASTSASAASSAQITTPKTTQSAPETPPVTISGNEISVAPVNGCEYSLDNQNWTTTNIFDNLVPGSSYTVYVRYVASSTSLASDSTAVKVAIPLVANPSTGDHSDIINPFLLLLGYAAFLVALVTISFRTHKRAQK